MATTIKQSLTAAGVSEAALVLACDFVVSGPFVGAWRMTALINDEWLTIRSGSQPVAITDLRFSLRRQVRFEADEVTSGGINVSLNGRDFDL